MKQNEANEANASSGCADGRGMLFVLYPEDTATMLTMPDESRHAIMDYLLQSVAGQTVTATVNPLEGAIANMLMAKQLRNADKYAETCGKRREAGRRGGLKSAAVRSKTKQNEANEANASFAQATPSNAKQTQANASKTNQTVNRKPKTENYKPKTVTKTRASFDNVADTNSGDSSPCFSDSDSRDAKDYPEAYVEIHDRNRDPVGIALAITGETGDKLAANSLRKRLRTIGEQRFRQVVASFWGEVEAGEEPDNRGAALMARLNAAAGEATR